MSNSQKEFTIQQVKEHNTPGDLWIVIRNKVYDVSVYMDEHPGGDIIMDALPGMDATLLFDDVGHSDEALEIMEGLCIGTLVTPKL